MDNIISAFWIILEILCCHLFMESFLAHRVPISHFYLIYFISWMVMFSCSCFASSSTLLIYVFFPVILCSSLYLFQGNILHHILITILCILLFCVSDVIFTYGICTITSISFEELSGRKLTYLTIVTVGKLFNILIAWLVHRFRNAGHPQKIQSLWLFYHSYFLL